MNGPIFVVNAGHGNKTAGKRCDKKLDPFETREHHLNDRVADDVQMELVNNYDCTVIRTDDTTGAKDILLPTRVSTANKNNAVVYISIHHNAGAKRSNAGGTVVFYYPTGNCKEVATRLYNHIVAQTGLIGDRATPVADGKHLYEVRATKMPCYLIENGFMDSAIDVPIILSEEHAKKTARGIVNFLVEEYSLQPLKIGASQTGTVVKPNTTVNAKKYIYGGVDYSLVFDHNYYCNKYPDLMNAFGTNATKLLSHFIIYGIKECRQAKSTFNVKVYKDSHADLQRAFGNDMKAYVQHYLTYGCNEPSRKTV